MCTERRADSIRLIKRSSFMIRWGSGKDAGDFAKPWNDSAPVRIGAEFQIATTDWTSGATWRSRCSIPALRVAIDRGQA